MFFIEESKKEFVLFRIKYINRMKQLKNVFPAHMH